VLAKAFSAVSAFSEEASTPGSVELDLEGWSTVSEKLFLLKGETNSLMCSSQSWAIEAS
jgi:hypothetical protein